MTEAEINGLILDPNFETDANNNYVVVERVDSVGSRCQAHVGYILYHDVKRSRSVFSSHRWLQFVVGVAIGVFIMYVTLVVPMRYRHCCSQRPLGENAFPADEKTGRKEKGLFFIAVMTSKDFVDTRAAALWGAWGRDVPWKLVFFAGDNGVPSRDDFPLVRLPGVDDVYPPQKKSFKMIEYMYHHYLDDYEWFIRADDDVFYKVFDDYRPFLGEMMKYK